MIKPKDTTCWCGSQNFSQFSDEYVLCKNCQTLILKEWADESLFSVQQDEQDFYGKSYWFEHQEKDLGFTNIMSRARTDLPERALHWLKTLLKYRLPPGETLELGCSHGGFVALLNWVGFQASGLEMSPWVVDFARKTFHIPVYEGELEKQKIPLASLDVIVLMDVLEHLPNPSITLSRCLDLLKPDGILLIQTPCYQNDKTYQQMEEKEDPFLQMLKSPEHVYLYSKSSVTEFFDRLGLEQIVFEPAFFSQYDMFFVVSRSPLAVNTLEQIEEILLQTPGGRLVLALLDKEIEYQNLKAKNEEVEFDRAARLEQINHIEELLKESEADRAARLEQIHQYDAWLKETQSQVTQYNEMLRVAKAKRATRLERINQLEGMLKISEADRAARLEQINQYAELFKESEADRAARLVVIQDQEKIIEQIRKELEKIKETFLYKAGRRLGIFR